MRPAAFLIPLMVSLLGGTRAAAGQDFAEQFEPTYEEQFEPAYDTSEQIQQYYSDATGIQQDIEDGDAFSATAQALTTMWRDFNDRFTSPTVRGLVDRVWEEDQGEIDRQREQRRSSCSDCASLAW